MLDSMNNARIDSRCTQIIKHIYENAEMKVQRKPENQQHKFEKKSETGWPYLAKIVYTGIWKIQLANEKH